MTELHDVPIADLHPHPDNPRLRLRDDVVTQIAAEITRSGFGREHALLVRPVDDGYQIISGHHRVEAAKRVGLDAVPCWVREMDDDEAFMQLILTNTQGEMSALEEGHHVATYVEHADLGAGRGNRGGLRDYARRLNKNESTLRKRALAYRVYVKCVGETHFKPDKLGHTHLWEIGQAPEKAWIPLVSAWSPRSFRRSGQCGTPRVP